MATLALPPDSATGMPIGLPPSVNVTVPVGDCPETMAVKVTDWPAADGLSDDVKATLLAARKSLTVRVKLCVASGLTPLVAVTASVYTPPVPAAGVPLITPVAVLSDNPPGSAGETLNVGAGAPAAAKLNVPGDPTMNVVLVPLVNAGACKILTKLLCTAMPGVAPETATGVTWNVIEWPASAGAAV